MHDATEGIPASTDLSAEKWQYWQSIWNSPSWLPAWVLWGKAMGWMDVAVMSGAGGSPSWDCTNARVAKAAMPLTATSSHGFFIGSNAWKGPHRNG
jgi:hypothetical protein